MSFKRNIGWHYFVIVINVAILIGLFVLMNRNEIKEHNKIREAIINLKSTNLLLDQQVIKLSFRQVQNYDLIAHYQNQLLEYLAEIRQHTKAASLSPQITQAFGRTKRTVTAVRNNLEYVKRPHGLIINSNAYAQKIMDELTNDLKSGVFVNEIISLKEKLASHSLFQTRQSFDEAIKQMDKIESSLMRMTLSNVPGPNRVTQKVSDTILEILKHVEISIKKNRELKQAIDGYFAIPKAYDELFSAFEAEFQKHKAILEKIIILFYVMLLGSWLHVAYLIFEVLLQNKRVREQAGELEKSLQKEREVNESQRKFVSMISHEFRTPLAVIDTNAQKLVRRAEKITSEKIAETGIKIRSNIVRLIDLLESMLNTQRMEAGKIEYSPGVCDLQKVVFDICQMQGEISTENKISLDIKELPDRFMGDSKLLHHVFTNLISNAVKYSPKGTDVIVSVGQVNKHIEISVSDCGVGIPSDELPNLFECFFRASTSVGISGTGIGLHLVKKIIDLHSGTIEVESEVGVGSKFIVYLPIADIPAEEIDSDKMVA